VGVFQELGSQWRVAHSGPYGLDYNVLPMLFDLHEIPQSERLETMRSIRVMESAALEEMRPGNV
jgi:hypothetical protein